MRCVGEFKRGLLNLFRTCSYVPLPFNKYSMIIIRAHQETARRKLPRPSPPMNCLMTHGGCVAKTAVKREGLSSVTLLCCEMEERCNELCLSACILTAQSFHLTFSHHVHCLDTLQGSFRRRERLVALRGSHPLLHEAMILFDDVIEILYSPQLAIMR